MKASYNAHKVFERASRRRGEALINLFFGTGLLTTIILGCVLFAMWCVLPGDKIYVTGLLAPSLAIWIIGAAYGAKEEPEPLNTYDRGIGEFEAKQLWQDTIGQPSLNDILPIFNAMFYGLLVSAVLFSAEWIMNGGSLGAGEHYVTGELFSAFIMSLGYLTIHSFVRAVLFMNITKALKKKKALRERLISQY